MVVNMNNQMNEWRRRTVKRPHTSANDKLWFIYCPHWSVSGQRRGRSL